MLFSSFRYGKEEIETELSSQTTTDTQTTTQIFSIEETIPAETMPVESETKTIYIEKSVPKINTSFKAYMDYRTITNKKSNQWELQQQAITDGQGFRKYNGKYMVALGTYYAPRTGIEVKITLDSGVVFEAIIGDIKDDRHTNSTNQYVPLENGGNLVEFIVDTDAMDNKILRSGNVSKLGLQGSVVKVEVKSE